MLLVKIYIHCNLEFEFSLILNSQNTPYPLWLPICAPRMSLATFDPSASLAFKSKRNAGVTRDRKSIEWLEARVLPWYIPWHIWRPLGCHVACATNHWLEQAAQRPSPPRKGHGCGSCDAASVPDNFINKPKWGLNIITSYCLACMLQPYFLEV